MMVEEQVALLSWAQWLDGVKHDAGLASEVAGFLDYAREVARRPIFERVYELADVGEKGRTWLDGRYRGIPRDLQETFVLSMSDCNSSGQVLEEMPLLAAAYRLSADPVLRERTLAQLRELATWSPLQRPGWSYHDAKSKPFTDPKGDGNWLATGNLLVAIVETLQILPADAVPADLRAKLEVLLASEIEGCLDDWQVRRPWFYRWQNPFTNQWVVPTAGYLMAASFLGRAKYAEAYELGVGHLRMSLDAYGPEGAQVEGHGYGSFTVLLLWHAARWIAVEGDDRLISHPFLRHFPRWLVQHVQPGGFTINAFDQGGGPKVVVTDGRRQVGCRVLLGLCALSGDPDARWAVRHTAAGGPANLGWLMARSVPAADDTEEPPLWAVYDRARRVNWRSSWSEDASGVWVRGCHPDDQHSHADHGHVNFIRHGRPILIEAGACQYHSPVGRSHFAGPFGHNLLTLGTLTPDAARDCRLTEYPRGFPAPQGNVPITVVQLDGKGGELTVDPTTSYKGAVRQWTRRVVWDAERLGVTDTVELPEPDVINFRWHLGTVTAPVVTGRDLEWRVCWEAADLAITADVPLTLAVEPMQDNTLGTREPDEQTVYPTHACLVVRTLHPESRGLFQLKVLS